jgi:heme-degrading monooxygenase HmoA
MFKVIIERQVREGEDISPLLRELRAAAMHYPGYVSGETLVSTQDSSIVITISTWQSLEDWKQWEASDTRAKLYQQIQSILIEKPKVSTYRITATEETR